MTKIKVCGIQNDRIFPAIRKLNIEYMGFIFAPSKRQINIDQANKLIHDVRTTFTCPPKCVGVFRNPSYAELTQILTEVPLDVVQLHGAEAVELCAAVKQEFPVQLLKVFSATNQSIASELIELAGPYRSVMDMMLIDTHDPQYGGGAGVPFRWELLPPVQSWCESQEVPLFVAGGLQPDNIQSLLATYHPFGIDASSGLETDGEKDVSKVISFVERVRTYDYSS
jgi:phosphoribosylanthranilate isomerase